MKKLVSLLLIAVYLPLSLTLLLTYVDLWQGSACGSDEKGLPFSYASYYRGGPTCGVPMNDGKIRQLPLLTDIAFVMTPAVAYYLLYTSKKNENES